MRSNFRTPLVLPESTDLPMGIAEIEKDEGLLFLGTPAEKEGPGRRARERERERETADHRRPPTHCLPRSLRVPRSLVTSRPHKGHDALLPWPPSPHLQLLSHVRPDQVFFGSRSLLEQLLARLSYVFLTYASCSLGSAADPLSLSLPSFTASTRRPSMVSSSAPLQGVIPSPDPVSPSLPRRPSLNGPFAFLNRAALPPAPIPFRLRSSKYLLNERSPFRRRSYEGSTVVAVGT